MIATFIWYHRQNYEKHEDENHKHIHNKVLKAYIFSLRNDYFFFYKNDTGLLHKIKSGRIQIKQNFIKTSTT